MRLIDADALCKRLKAEAINQMEQSPNGRADSAAMAFSDAWEMANNAHTIALESLGYRKVTRCKNCSLYERGAFDGYAGGLCK